MLSRWPGGLGALVVTLVVVALGGELVRALTSVRSGGSDGYSPGRLDDAVRDLKAASSPLLQVLDPQTRSAVRGDQAG